MPELLPGCAFHLSILSEVSLLNFLRLLLYCYTNVTIDQYGYSIDFSTRRSCSAKLPGRLHRLHLGCTQQNVVISHRASSQPVAHAALRDSLWEKVKAMQAAISTSFKRSLRVCRAQSMVQKPNSPRGTGCPANKSNKLEDTVPSYQTFLASLDSRYCPKSVTEPANNTGAHFIKNGDGTCGSSALQFGQGAS